MSADTSREAALDRLVSPVPEEAQARAPRTGTCFTLCTSSCIAHGVVLTVQLRQRSYSIHFSSSNQS